LQIETLTAVTHARQLAKPGVDCLTWGPSDLSFDLEAHPTHPFQTVDDCLRHVLKQLEGTDIRVSFRNYSYELRQKYMDMGVTVFMERPR
jgi:2-keto-3-deoxy-L-rhamnonate aldolase RhmA